MQERPGASKGHQQVGGRFGGGRYPSGIEKADVQGLPWAQSRAGSRRRLCFGSRGAAGDWSGRLGQDSRRQVREFSGRAVPF